MATATDVRTESKADPAEGKGVVLYDGLCPLCQRSVRILKRLDWLKKLHCQDCRDTANLPKSEVPLDPKRMLEEMHLVTPDRKRVYAGFKAFRWMAWRIPVTMPFAWMMYIPGVPWLGNKIYLWVAKNRYDLVPCKDGVCQLPLRGKATGGRGQEAGDRRQEAGGRNQGSEKPREPNPVS